MIHLATEELDRGPVVSYCTAPITGPEFRAAWQEVEGLDLEELQSTRGEELPLFQQIRQAQYRREPYLIFETLRAVAGGRIVLAGSRVLDQQGCPIAASGTPGLCLDEEIDQAMAADVPG